MYFENRPEIVTVSYDKRCRPRDAYCIRSLYQIYSSLMAVRLCASEGFRVIKVLPGGGRASVIEG